MTLSADRLSLHNQLLSATGETVSVNPVDGSIMEDVDALRGESGTETHNTAMQGYRLTAQYTDWLIAVSELDDGYIPSTNDVITDADGNEFRVVQDKSTSRTWRYSSPQKHVMRIHSKPEDER